MSETPAAAPESPKRGFRHVRLVVALAVASLLGTFAVYTSGLRFTVKDYKGTQTVPVVYTGAVPDAYKVGRDIVIDGTLENGVLKAVPDTLVTKCPSKYTDQATPSDAKT